MAERTQWARRSVAGCALLLAVAACGGDDALPPDQAWAPTHRFVDLVNGVSDVVTRDRPRAAVRDDSRFVLREPRRASVIFGRALEDRRGNRLLRQVQILPEELEGASELLVLRSVKVGGRFLEPPPVVLPSRPGGKHSSVALEFPIPANPEGRKVVIGAQAYGLDLVDLSRLDAPPVEIPEGARLEFAVGVVEPDWGHDAVEFRVRACEGERCETLHREAYDPAGADGGRWREGAVSLAHLAGRRLALRFEAERLERDGPFSLPVWANPTLYAPAPRRPEQRNVILLSVDTLRADHLPSYGYPHETAPFVAERFERGGTVFDQPVAAATITTPSHATMFTALTPTAHGTVDGMRTLPKHISTLAEQVRHGGRDAAAFTENGWLSVRHGFDRGFDVFVENRSADIMDPDGQVDRTFGQAREWLRRNRDKRFFLFLHTFQVHTPYAPPRRYRDLFREREGGDIDDASPSHLRWMLEYDQEIRYVDDELERLFETIDALELGRDTVFVLTSDHGEAFLEHGQLEHGARLDDEVLRVPLLLWGRGVPGGRRVEVPVGHVDLMPTILDLMALPVPEGREGLSLLALLDGGGVEAFAGRPLYAEARGVLGLGPERRMLPFEPPGFAVRIGDRKLARYRRPDGGFRYELYDLARDPGELRDLYPAQGAEATELRELIAGYEERGRRVRARVDRGAPEDADSPVELDPEQEAKLRALGYLR